MSFPLPASAAAATLVSRAVTVAVDGVELLLLLLLLLWLLRWCRALPLLLPQPSSSPPPPPAAQLLVPLFFLLKSCNTSASFLLSPLIWPLPVSATQEQLRVQSPSTSSLFDGHLFESTAAAVAAAATTSLAVDADAAARSLLTTAGK